MLTPSQYVALKAFASADPAMLAAINSGDDVALADWLNAQTETIVWRTSVSWDEIMLNGMDWTRCDNLSVGKARIWDWLFRNQNNAMNPSAQNIRDGIDQAWVGTAADLAVRAMIYTHCKRAATRLEAALAIGAGTTAAPAVMTAEGEISYAEASLVRVA